MFVKNLLPILETLREIALFLDTPVFLIQEDKVLLSEILDNQIELLFIFENVTDKDFKNKQGERVLEKLMQALVAKYPALAQMQKAEIVAEKHLEWNFADTKIQKVIVFGESLAKSINLHAQVYQIVIQHNIQVVVSKSIETIETQMEEKKTIWNTLLQLFEG